MVPGLRASSPVPVSKGMLKVKEDQRSNVYVVSPAGVLQVSSFGILVLPLLALVQRTIWKERHQFFINCNDVRDAVVDTVLVAKAAAALQGTGSSVHSGPWEAQHKVQPVQFFVKGKAGSSTSVVRGCLEEVLSQVVGTDGLDVYATMNGKMLDLCSTLLSCGITDGCTVHVHFRLRGGSREDVPGQWTCSQCFAPRCWPVRKRCYRCGAARDDLPVSAEGKGNGKVDVAVGPLGRKPPQTVGNVPPTTRRPQVVPPRGPPGAGVGSPPTPESPPSPPSEELVKALQLLQSVLTPEDFSKFDKKLVPPKQQERVKLRERELLEAVERQANYEKQEQKHLEMIAKHEHNSTQQKAMLESVRTQLAEVRDTVGALRALVRRRGPVSQVAGLVSSGKVAGPVVGGTAQMFAGFETDLRDVDATQFGGSAPAAETDFDGAQCVHVPRGAAAEFCSAVAVPSGPPGLVGSFDVGGGHELPAAENTSSGTQFCGTRATLPGPICRAGSAGVRTGDARHPSRGAVVAQRHQSGGGQRHGRRAGSGAVAGFGQQARCERAEAGSCLDSDVLLSVRVENPSARVARVITALHQNSYSTPARSLHDVHVARCVQNSMNSLGDGVVRGRGFLRTRGNKVVEYVYSDWGQASCYREACFSTAGASKVA